MTDERLLELLPLAALGVLDGDDKAYLDDRLARDERAQRDLRAFEQAVARIAFDTAWVTPSPELRPRVLAAATETATAPRAAAPAATPPSVARGGLARLATGLASAAALLLALGLLVVRSQRDGARREAEAARLEATTAVAQAQRALAERDAARRSLAEEQAFRFLVGRPDSRVASLAGLPAAPGARGRVIWNPASREAVLLASGLAPAPEGKAYEVWVIAQGPPVPAGLFQVDASGNAVARLPVLDDLARVKTFAVTLEPAAGTAAPTGPMVLAGAT